jgi:hypothetical protein
MQAGIPVHRHWVLVLRDGPVVVDWGDGLFQDLHTGQFQRGLEGKISHPAQNVDLVILQRAGLVDHFDDEEVWLLNLPERPSHLMD